MSILKELKNRGILNNVTNEDKLKSLDKGEGVYIGFDPTAQSLHLGNYIQIAILKRFESFGFKPVAVVGGATGMIGDPSGKSAERNLQSKDELESNKFKIKKQLESFGLKVVDNYDFYKNMNVLDFLRDAGKLLNVSYMINKEVVKSRLESGISFTEFAYQLIQGWDFKSLFENHGVKVQVGGSDQWGNITAGIEIIRKTNGDESKAVGITTELLTTSTGAKFGKSEGNALFLDKEMTAPFDIYQYVLNTPDADVEKLLMWLTFVKEEKIKSVIEKHNEDPKSRYAQKFLANELIKDIHDEEELKKVETITAILFGSKEISTLDTKEASSLINVVPTFENVNGNILDVLIETNLASSKREGREFLQSGAVEVNGKKISSEDSEVKFDKFDGKVIILKRGKKKFVVIKK